MVAQIPHGSESAYFLRPGITHVVRLTLYSLRTEKLMQNSKANPMPRNQIPLIWPAVAKIATTRTEQLMINSKANLTSRNQCGFPEVPKFATTQAPFVCDLFLQSHDIHFSTPAAFVVFQRKMSDSHKEY